MIHILQNMFHLGSGLWRSYQRCPIQSSAKWWNICITFLQETRCAFFMTWVSTFPGKQERYCGIIPGNQILTRHRDSDEGSCRIVMRCAWSLQWVFGFGIFMISLSFCEIDEETFTGFSSHVSKIWPRRLSDFVYVCCMYAFFTWDLLTWVAHRARKILADNLQSCEPNYSNEIGTTAATGCLHIDDFMSVALL